MRVVICVHRPFFVLFSVLIIKQIAAALPTQPEIDACLAAHNNRRALHQNTDPLTYSTDAALLADTQAWADNMLSTESLSHSTGSGYGENIAYAASSQEVYDTCVEMMNRWYDNEESNYNYATGETNGGVIGHFTQVVWKASQQLSFGIARGQKGSWYKVYAVARFTPPGNYVGQNLNQVGNIIASNSVTTTTAAPTTTAAGQSTQSTVSTTSGSTISTGPTTTGATVTTGPTTTEAPTTTTTTEAPYVPPPQSKAEQCVECHNSRRLKHAGTPDMTWDTELESLSQAWGEHLISTNAFAHDPKNSEQQTGENLYSYSGSGSAGVTCENACKAWYDEIEDYDFTTHGKKAGSTAAIGHFTQMVWKATTKIGVAIVVSGQKVIIVAKYRTQGNFIGRYGENVLPTTASASGVVEDQTPPPKPPPQAPSPTYFDVDPPSFCTNRKFRFTFVYVILVFLQRGQTRGPRNPKDYTLAELRLGVDGLIIIHKWNNPVDYSRPCRCGRSSSSRRRRDVEDVNAPIAAVNSPLTAEASYTVFYRAEINNDTAITSDYYEPVRTQPSGGGDYCSVTKSCSCDTLPLVDPVDIANNISYYGLNDTAVNSSLTAIGTWDRESVLVLCKQAQCDETSLSTAVTNVDSDANKTRDDMTIIATAKTNIRLAIDCLPNNNGTRALLFDQYDTLCKRYVIMNNVLEDLQLKRNVLEKEKERCQKRGWLRQVLENIWHKS